MRRFSAHDRFFSSLKQVEKRLASEKEPTATATPSTPTSFSSPLYLSSKPQPAAFTPHPLDESSGPPSEFLSVHPSPEQDPDCPTHEARSYYKDEDEEDDEEKDVDDDGDDIDRLIGLLGLSADGEDGSGVGSCHCSGGGFYRNTVGIRGPMCAREMERLDGWIEHYHRGKSEPARLAHLLLAKAISAADASGRDGDDCFGDVGFPPTVENFLEYDPPSEKGEQQFLREK